MEKKKLDVNMCNLSRTGVEKVAFAISPGETIASFFCFVFLLKNMESLAARMLPCVIPKWSRKNVSLNSRSDN